MVITLQCITDVYSKPNKAGIQKVIKRNLIYKKQFESTAILVEQYINAKGEPSKRWSTIKYGEEYFRLNHKFEDMEKLTKHMVIKGFM